MAFKSQVLLALAVTITTLSTQVLGHLYINSPVPFDVAQIDNSPLNDVAPGSSTSNFPCKVPASGGGYSYTITQMNNMTVGEPQLLSFVGSASHGGGTCQLAITMDLEPTASSIWKLIQVYEGGCPIQADGNDGTHPFTYEIPKDFPNGRATLSWTWYNRIGNREIYQNCAPITVSGGSDDHDYYNTLPEWYIINLPSQDCSTPENDDVIIPNPGQFIMTGGASAPASASGPSCSASAATQTQSVSGYQSNVVTNLAAYSGPGGATGPATGSAVAVSTPSAVKTTSSVMASTTAPVSSPASPTAAASTLSNAVTASAASSSGLVTLSTFITVTATGTPPPATNSVAAVSSSAITPTGSAAPPTGTGTSGSGSTAGTTCTTDGAIVCNGSSQFGICNFGSVVWQDVAAGTTCSNGVISKRDVRDVKVRRALQHEAVKPALYTEEDKD